MSDILFESFRIINNIPVNEGSSLEYNQYRDTLYGRAKFDEGTWRNDKMKAAGIPQEDKKAFLQGFCKILKDAYKRAGLKTDSKGVNFLPVQLFTKAENKEFEPGFFLESSKKDGDERNSVIAMIPFKTKSGEHVDIAFSVSNDKIELAKKDLYKPEDKIREAIDDDDTSSKIFLALKDLQMKDQSDDGYLEGCFNMIFEKSFNTLHNWYKENEEKYANEENVRDKAQAEAHKDLPRTEAARNKELELSVNIEKAKNARIANKSNRTKENQLRNTMRDNEDFGYNSTDDGEYNDYVENLNQYNGKQE